MNGARVVEAELHILAERTGIWCETCALPWALGDDAIALSSTLRVIGRGTATACTECCVVGGRRR